MHYQAAKYIMGRNIIGPKEFLAIAQKLHIAVPVKVPEVPYDAQFLKRIAKDHILIFGVSKDKNGRPLTLNILRELFGLNPSKKGPCFYNQDWYINEEFASKTRLKNQWYIIRKNVMPGSRSLLPDIIEKRLKKAEKFPPAILTAFTFFAYYFLTEGEVLWEHDFIWCSDKDKNGDRIYTGRYRDPRKINKNGFNIHRHLSIRSCYGIAPQII